MGQPCEFHGEGAASGKNIRQGDIVSEAQQEPVETVAAFEGIVDKVKKTGAKSIILLVEDAKGDTRFVGVPINP